MPQSRLRRIARILGIAGLTLAVALVLCLCILAARLAYGPIAVADAGPWIDAALARSLGAGNHVTSGPAELAWTGRGLAVAVEDAVIGNDANANFVSAQKAEVTLDPRALLSGQVAVKSVAFVDPIVTLKIGTDGRLLLGRAAADTVPQAVDGTPSPPPHGLLAIVKELFEGNGPFAAIHDVEIRDGRLAVRDERTSEDLLFDELNFSFLDTTNGHRFAISFNGPLGPSSLSGTITRADDQGRQIHLAPAAVPLGYFLLPFLPQREAIGMNSPVRGSLDAAFDSADQLQLVSGDLALVALSFGGNEAAPPAVLADRLAVRFTFDPAERLLQLRRGELAFGHTQVLVSGTAAAGSEGWKVDLTGNASLNGDPNEAWIETDSLALRAHLPENLSDFAIDDLVIAGEGTKLELSGDLGTQPDGSRIARITASAGPMNARSLVALWPPNLSQQLRATLKEHLVRAHVDRIDVVLDLSEQNIRDLADGRGVAGDAASLNLDLTDVAFQIDPKPATIVAPAMTLHATGEEANLIIPSARLGETGGPASPDISQWRMTVSDLTGATPMLQSSLRLQGPTGGLASLFEANALPLKSSTGSLDANVEARLPLAEIEVGLVESLAAKGTLSDFALADLGNGIGIDKAQLQIELNQGKLSLSGNGRILGSASKVSLISNVATGGGDAQASFTLDEAARSRLGWDSAALTGPIGVDFRGRLTKGNLDTANVSLDLAKAAIASPIAGLGKTAGRPGRASFQIKSLAKGISLENISYSAPPVSFTGRAQVADGSLNSASLQKISLVSGDNIDAKIERIGRGWKIGVTGASLDARPFLVAARRRESSLIEAQIDARIARLTGYAGERIRDANLRVQIGGRGPQQFNLEGAIGSGRISAMLDQAGAGQWRLETSDVGALLRYFDLYGAMIGGRGTVQASLEGDRFRGQASVDDFTLWGDPLLNKSAEVIRQSSGRIAQSERAKGDQRFQKLKLDFVGAGSKIDIRDATLNGSDVGITFEGWIDLAAQRVSLAGTYVPAFGLNSALTSIPIVGTLLGGGQDGLLGVTFRLDGLLQDPKVRVNPLSALAPGIFRQIFGYEPRRS
jgi:hypothetical protein